MDGRLMLPGGLLLGQLPFLPDEYHDMALAAFLQYQAFNQHIAFHEEFSSNTASPRSGFNHRSVSTLSEEEEDGDVSNKTASESGDISTAQKKAKSNKKRLNSKQRRKLKKKQGQSVVETSVVAGNNENTSQNNGEIAGEEHATDDPMAIKNAPVVTINGGGISARQQCFGKETADQLADQATRLAKSRDKALLPSAIQLLTEAIRLYPHCAGYYGNRSLCFYHMNEFESSLNDATLAIYIEPLSLKYLYRKAMALFRLERFSEAQDIVGNMLAVEPRCQQALDLKEQIREAIIKALENIGEQSSLCESKEDDDCVVGVAICNLPNSVTAEIVRDLVCSKGIKVDAPVLFINDTSGNSDDKAVGAVVHLSDIAMCEKAMASFANYPYGIKRLVVKIITKSVYASLNLLDTVPNQVSLESALSDSEDDIVDVPGPSENSRVRNATNTIWLQNGDLFEQHGEISWIGETSDVQTKWPTLVDLPINRNSSGSKEPNTKATKQPEIGKKLTSSSKTIVSRGPDDFLPSNSKDFSWSLFIGNVPIDSSIAELEQFVKSRINGALPSENYVVSKRPNWDYAFINVQKEDEGKLIRDALDKVRFSGVILEAKLSSVEQANKPLSSMGFNSSNTALINVRLSHFDKNIKFHEFFHEIYPIILSAVAADFTIYRQTSWELYCFLNFLSKEHAALAAKRLQGLKTTFSPEGLVANVCDGRLDKRPKLSWPLKYKFSLDEPSRLLRVENIDGALSDNAVKQMFPGHTTFNRPYPICYIGFRNSTDAVKMFQSNQGRKAGNSPLIIRFAHNK